MKVDPTDPVDSLKPSSGVAESASLRRCSERAMWYEMIDEASALSDHQKHKKSLKRKSRHQYLAKNQIISLGKCGDLLSMHGRCSAIS